VRPLLVFCAAPRPALEDPATLEHLLSAAAAVELVHMATLVHDDLLDGATMRRGRPTVAEELGAERAVSTGDFLFARAFAELTRTRSAPAVQALAGAALDLSQGEMDQGRAAFDLTLTEGDYLARCRRKTAALFSVACRMGALIGGAGPRRSSGWRPRRERRDGLPDLRRHPRPRRALASTGSAAAPTSATAPHPAGDHRHAARAGPAPHVADASPGPGAELATASPPTRR
jgi:hypothetical protein